MVVYLDDILFTYRTNGEHFANSREVFVRLNGSGLKLNLSKWLFFLRDVKYREYIINALRLKTYPATRPFEHIQIDFLDPVENIVFLTILNIYTCTKWLENYICFQKFVAITIDKLRKTFTRFGLQRKIISDYETPFVLS